MVWLESADLEIHQWVTGTLIGVFTWHTLITTSKKLIARLAVVQHFWELFVEIATDLPILL
jgi:hypothetical protein